MTAAEDAGAPIEKEGMLPSFRRELTEALRAASVLTRPFPHLHGAVSNPALGAVFKMMRGGFPTREAVPDPGDPESYRGIVRWGELEGGQRALWDRILPNSFTEELSRLLLEKFLAFIPRYRRRDLLRKALSALFGGSRFPALTATERSVLLASRREHEWIFTNDGPGYSLEPHTDHPRKMITFLMYLSEPGGRTLPGTSLFAPLSRRSSWDSVRAPRKDFREVFRAPHLEGRFLAFVKSDLSWHGVEPCREIGHQRMTLNLTLRRPEEAG